VFHAILAAFRALPDPGVERQHGAKTPQTADRHPLERDVCRRSYGASFPVTGPVKGLGRKRGDPKLAGRGGR